MAIPVGALVSAGGSILGGLFGASSANKAADAQAKAARDALNLQREQFNYTTERLDPFYSAGVNALGAYSSAVMGGGAASAPFIPEITTQTVAASGGGISDPNTARINALQARRPDAMGDREQLREIDREIARLRQSAPQSTPGAGGTTNYLVGDQTFGSMQEAEAYRANLLAQSQASQAAGQSVADMRPEWDQNFNPAQIMADSGMAGVTTQGNQTYFDAAAGFESSPGYEFMRDEAMQAAERSAAARGLRLSGGTMESLQNRATGLAQQDYYNYLGQRERNFGANYARNAGTYTDSYNAQYGQYTDALNRLAGLAGMGQNAAAQQGAAAQSFGQSGGNMLTQAGNAAASGILGQNDAMQGTLNNLFTVYGANQAGLFNQPTANQPTRASGYGGMRPGSMSAFAGGLY